MATSISNLGREAAKNGEAPGPSQKSQARNPTGEKKERKSASRRNKKGKLGTIQTKPRLEAYYYLYQGLGDKLDQQHE